MSGNTQYTMWSKIQMGKELKSYYVDLKKGYIVGDFYKHRDKDYQVIEIEAFNNLMLVEEIKDESNK